MTRLPHLEGPTCGQAPNERTIGSSGPARSLGEPTVLHTNARPCRPSARGQRQHTRPSFAEHLTLPIPNGSLVPPAGACGAAPIVALAQGIFGHAAPMRLHSRGMTRPTADRHTLTSDASPHEGLEEQRALMRAVAAGDAAAYRALCARYLGPINGFAQRMLGNEAEGEEVAQETFLRVWKDAGRYAPTAAVSTWIYRIARNLCIDHLRRRKETSNRISQVDAVDRTGALLDRKQLASEVNRALGELPERQRAAICLVHYDGLSQAEAAGVLEVGTEALESLLARGRRTLRKKLAGLQASAAESADDQGA